MLSERSIIKQIEILDSGHIQVQKANQIIREEGTEQEEIVSTEHWRTVIDPLDIVTAEQILGPEKINIAKAAWNIL